MIYSALLGISMLHCTSTKQKHLNMSVEGIEIHSTTIIRLRPSFFFWLLRRLLTILSFMHIPGIHQRLNWGQHSLFRVCKLLRVVPVELRLFRIFVFIATTHLGALEALSLHTTKDQQTKTCSHTNHNES